MFKSRIVAAALIVAAIAGRNKPIPRISRADPPGRPPLSVARWAGSASFLSVLRKEA